MSELSNVSSLWPALAFLLAGVPLAALLDRLGFFGAVAAVIARRTGGDVPLLALWALAAVTTIVLNLDTTIVLLTPLYLRLARHAGVDPLPVALIPLLLASLASSVLPISNLTTLVVAEHFDLGVGEVVAHLGIPSAIAIGVGWLAYRRRHPTRLSVPQGTVDRRALAIGSAVVVALLVGFVVGPAFGVDPWITVLAVDLVLAVVTRCVPWRAVPVITAAAVAVLAVVVELTVPEARLARVLASTTAPATALLAITASALANAVNNLPATMVALGAEQMSWGTWSWLLGVNSGAVLLPIGALANLLWLRIVRADGVEVGLGRYVRTVVPVAFPAFAAAIAALVVSRLVAG